MSLIQDVVWVASYPKSGNTWIHQLLKALAMEHGFPSSANLDMYQLRRSNTMPPEFPKIRSEVSPNACAVLKTHDIWKDEVYLHGNIKLKTKGFIYVRRNPLDVLLSFLNFSRINYLNSPNKKEYGKCLFYDLLGFGEIVNPYKWKEVTIDDIPRENLDHALVCFSKNGTSIPNMQFCDTWLKNNYSWHNAKVESEKRVILKYEDCMNDLDVFKSLLDLFDFTENELFEKLLTLNSKSQRMRDNGHIFYNKMSSFYYMKYFSKKRIIDFLTEHHADLETLGYADLPY